MGTLLTALLGAVSVAIISGGDLPQFKEQILAHLPPEADLTKLSLLPTCGTRFFRYRSTWHQLYAEDLSDTQKHKIIDALKTAVQTAGFEAVKTWGDVIEDRES